MKVLLPVSKSNTQFYINQSYIDYITASGHNPILISDVNEVEEMEGFCDALLLPGGKDIDPMFYSENNQASYEIDPAKDEFERRLFYSFLSKHKPIFGICRGFQLILLELLEIEERLSDSFFFVQDVDGHALNSILKVKRDYPTHYVRVLKGKRDFFTKGYIIKESTNLVRMGVNSLHHQGVFTLIPPIETCIDVLAIDANTTLSDAGYDESTDWFLVEAIDVPKYNIFAVQWHPEEMKDNTLKSFLGNSLNKRKEKKDE